MLLQHTKDGIKYIRKKWWEWLVVEVSGRMIRYPGQGEMIPRWYLPVSYDYKRSSYQCWLIPLAPFVLAFYIIWRTIKSIWHDLVEFADIMRNKYENR